MISRTHHWVYFNDNGTVPGDRVGASLGYVETTDNILNDRLVNSEAGAGELVRLMPKKMKDNERSSIYVKDVVTKHLNKGHPLSFEKLKDLWDIYKHFTDEQKKDCDFLIDMTNYKNAEAFYAAYPHHRPKDDTVPRGDNLHLAQN
ncbi:hypothetical protein TrCOL_g11352 [Triparma columacea]|uniref:Uncharacterized protein n=1 Tax=Triparma columacea TaxID=722753 RepID=A0A9W7LBA9_9STRA|nr:hypothetical protein TrCOL_g11352 [Triparma columacea]